MRSLIFIAITSLLFSCVVKNNNEDYFNHLSNGLVEIDRQIQLIKDSSLTSEKIQTQQRIFELLIQLQSARENEVKLKLIERDYKEAKLKIDSLMSYQRFLIDSLKGNVPPNTFHKYKHRDVIRF